MPQNYCNTIIFFELLYTPFLKTITLFLSQEREVLAIGKSLDSFVNKGLKKITQRHIVRSGRKWGEEMNGMNETKMQADGFYSFF